MAIVTGIVSCAVELSESSPMPVGAHRNPDGQPVACVDIAFPVVSLYGSVAAMRRLAGAATKAADEADCLPCRSAAIVGPVFRRSLAFADDAGELRDA